MYSFPVKHSKCAHLFTLYYYNNDSAAFHYVFVCLCTLYVHVFQACVLSTLLYGSESWTTYARHEKKLNSFHQRCLRRILHIKWQDKISNTEVLERANMRSIYTILCETQLHWLGHVKRMDPGRIPKDLLYGELAEGSRHAGRPKLRFKDVCKRDMKQCNIDSNS